jgi:hypothetical protein
MHIFKSKTMSSQISTIISFDIGTKNMALCITEVVHKGNQKSLRIKEWKRFDIDKENIEISCSFLVALLKNSFCNIKDDKNTWILIERQLPENKKCICVSFTTFTYFLTKFENANVSFVNAKVKPLISHGRKRKRESIETTKETLLNVGEDIWVKWFNSQIKKDDLADAYLQIVGCLENIRWYNINPIIIE